MKNNTVQKVMEGKAPTYPKRSCEKCHKLSHWNRPAGIHLSPFYYIMKKLHFILTFIFSLYTVVSMSQTLTTVPSVDLKKYAGKWYEIASFPQRFQKDCNCTTAEYTLTDKGYVMVENRCNKDSITGKQSYIKGKAFVVKNSGNTKLKVQFFWPFRGKYWIIDLADDYSYAVVGHPNRKYLWILSRTSKINDTTYQQIISKIKEKGFDTAQIKLTTQK
jgi:apolipoprotein D and lipocalin family protein